MKTFKNFPPDMLLARFLKWTPYQAWRIERWMTLDKRRNAQV